MAVKINALPANTLSTIQLADAYIPLSGIGANIGELYRVKVSDLAPAMYQTLGTSVTYNIGTSGATIPVLNANNVWTLTQSFTTATNGSGGVVIRATSGGQAALDFVSTDGTTLWGRFSSPSANLITTSTNVTFTGTVALPSTLTIGGTAFQQGFYVTATGTGASQSITIPAGFSAQDVEVFENGIRQLAGTHYTVSGTTISATWANGATIIASKPGGATGVQGPAGPGNPLARPRVSGRWYTTGNTGSTTSSTSINALNTIILYPIVLHTSITTQILAVHAQGGTGSRLSIAAYAADGVSSLPIGPALFVADTGTISATGVIEATFTSVTLPAGLMWLAVNQVDSTNVTFRTVGSTGTVISYLASIVGGNSSGDVLTGVSGPYQVLTYSQTFGTWPNFSGITPTVGPNTAFPLIVLKSN